MKHSKLLLFFLTVTTVSGCLAPFSRPAPTESEYQQRFLSHLEPSQIADLRFIYHGAVGGEMSIARFAISTNAIATIRDETQTEDAYDPAKEKAEEELRRKIAMCAGARRIPTWFDFPFQKTLPVFVDSGDSTSENPAYSQEWFVDKEEGVVYFLMVAG